MIKYIIIDDEHIAHDIIKGYCDMLPDMKLQKNCYDALEAIQYLNGNSVDLIFLDLNMPKLKGFDFLKTLNNPPKVIVTTAYSEFALEGYELNVSDYLLKPFGFERFLKAINKTFSAPAQTVIPKTEEKEEKRLFVQSENRYIQIAINDILFIEASGNYSKIVLANESLTTREKISDLLQTLSATDIIQCHRSFAVSVKHINSVEGNRIKIGDHEVPIGKMFKENVNKLLRVD